MKRYKGQNCCIVTMPNASAVLQSLRRVSSNMYQEMAAAASAGACRKNCGVGAGNSGRVDATQRDAAHSAPVPSAAGGPRRSPKSLSSPSCNDYRFLDGAGCRHRSLSRCLPVQPAIRLLALTVFLDLLTRRRRTLRCDTCSETDTRSSVLRVGIK